MFLFQAEARSVSVTQHCTGVLDDSSFTDMGGNITKRGRSAVIIQADHCGIHRRERAVSSALDG